MDSSAGVLPVHPSNRKIVFDSLLYKETISELISDAETSLVRNWFLFSGAIISAADTNLMAGWFRFAGRGKLIESHRAIAVSSASILLSIPAALNKMSRR
jgi:hypothetical protein